MNCLYTIPLCNFGFAFRHPTCVIVKDFGKALLKTKSSPIFFSYKLSERKPLFEIAQCHAWHVAEKVNQSTMVEVIAMHGGHEGKTHYTHSCGHPLNRTTDPL